jgi:hypothetical protein
MVASKPQIRNMFATPVCVHFHPVAQEANAELRPLIMNQAQNGGSSNREEGWRSAADFESWSGVQGQTLFRMLSDLANGLTASRNGGRVTALDWKITASVAIRDKGHYREIAARPGFFWSGIYYVDDGYHKADDESLGGEYELADPRGVLPAMIAPQYGFRMPGGLSAGGREIIRPQTGMIILHPSWVPSGERRFDGPENRIAIEFDMAAP